MVTDPADYPPPFKAPAHPAIGEDGAALNASSKEADRKSDGGDEKHKTENLTGSAEGGTDLGTDGAAGEDDGSAPIEGEDGHLTTDQKPTTK